MQYLIGAVVVIVISILTAKAKKADVVQQAGATDTRQIISQATIPPVQTKEQEQTKTITETGAAQIEEVISGGAIIEEVGAKENIVGGSIRDTENVLLESGRGGVPKAI